MFGRKKRRKLKFPKWTLEDCTEYYRKNREYRYAVVVGEEKTPIALCGDIESAETSKGTHLISGGRLPVFIIDLERDYMM